MSTPKQERRRRTKTLADFVVVRPRRKHGLQIEWCRDTPEVARKLAVNRTREMLIHYGRNITSLNIETLALSCYLQGVNDCFEYHEHKSKTVGN